MNKSSINMNGMETKLRLKKNTYSNNFKKYIYYYILLFPVLVYFLVFKYIPMAGVLIAFKDYSFARGILGSTWVGLDWFRVLFSNEEFFSVIRNTFLISFYKIIFGFPAPIILALLINEIKNKMFKRSIQTIVYFPHFLSWVVIGGMMFTLLSAGSGVLTVFGINENPLTKASNFRMLLVLSNIWKESGWGTVVYMAAMTGINPELYESSLIDGANRFQQAVYVTIPSIASTIITLLILRTGSVLYAGFEQVYMLSNPLVSQVAEIIDTYVFRYGLAVGRFSLATAAGVFQSIVGLALVLFTNWLARRMGEQGLW